MSDKTKQQKSNKSTVHIMSTIGAKVVLKCRVIIHFIYCEPC